MTSENDKLLAIAHQATDLAHNLIRTSAAGELTAKGDRDYASEVDYEIERRLREFLADATPGIGFLGEEHGYHRGENDRIWTLDPIDGTVNFAHTIPLCAISLALVQDDQPILGVIDLPFLGTRYHATQGAGAYQGSRRLAVRQANGLSDAVVALGDYAVGNESEQINEQRLAITRALANSVLRIRMLGSAAIDLAWLAEGRIDAAVALSNHPWDVAAGIIIAREAGAHVLDLDGTNHTPVSHATIGVTPSIERDLLTLLAKNV
jgi:myo-inositol-1(or 4)-monophosphatase